MQHTGLKAKMEVCNLSSLRQIGRPNNKQRPTTDAHKHRPPKYTPQSARAMSALEQRERLSSPAKRQLQIF